MADALVLDTSACFAFLEDEAGADVVESHLVDASSSPGYVYRNPYAASPSVNVRGYQTGLPLAVLRPGHVERSGRRDQDRCRLCAAPSIAAPNERHHALCRNAILF